MTFIRSGDDPVTLWPLAKPGYLDPLAERWTELPLWWLYALLKFADLTFALAAPNTQVVVVTV